MVLLMCNETETGNEPFVPHPAAPMPEANGANLQTPGGDTAGAAAGTVLSDAPAAPTPQAAAGVATQLVPPGFITATCLPLPNGTPYELPHAFSEEDVALFTGKNAKAYQKKWSKAGAHFNFGYLALDFFWFFYRKMWLEGIVYFIAKYLLLTVLEYFLPGYNSLFFFITTAFYVDAYYKIRLLNVQKTRPLCTRVTKLRKKHI